MVWVAISAVVRRVLGTAMTGADAAAAVMLMAPESFLHVTVFSISLSSFEFRPVCNYNW